MLCFIRFIYCSKLCYVIHNPWTFNFDECVAIDGLDAENLNTRCGETSQILVTKIMLLRLFFSAYLKPKHRRYDNPANVHIVSVSWIEGLS